MITAKINNFLGSKDKVNPVSLIDTLSNEENAMDTEIVENIQEPQLSTSKAHVDRFKTTKKVKTYLEIGIIP